MKIAQIAPLYEAVPPKLYGGTERVVHNLTEALVKLGHDVTLFASGDSQTSAKLIPTVEQALRLNPDCVDPLAPHIAQLQDVIDRAQQFDIIHFHTDYLHFPFSQHLNTAHVTTLHGRLDVPELQIVYDRFRTQPVISISDDQRRPLPVARFVGTVYHGIEESLHAEGKGQGGYLAFLGRISPEKNLPKAIEIAIAAGIPLKVAAKIDKADRHYYETEVKHLMNHPLVEYVGEINEEEKCSFLGNAIALLFPIAWSEPFGMVMIEANACGCPVVAHPRGSVREVISHGDNGFIFETVEQAVTLINHIRNDFDRSRVRKYFEAHFTSERMAKDYINIYEQLIEEKATSRKLKVLTEGTISFSGNEPAISKIG